jgi:hypothetical protein
MSSRSRIHALLGSVCLLLIAATGNAGTFTLHGPRDYVRNTSTPVTEETVFAASNTAIRYTVRLSDGGAQGQLTRVTSATVVLNGVALWAPGDFNASTPAVLEKTVTLAASNRLAVEVRGAPGSGLTLSIIGDDTDAPVISASVSPEPNAAGWNNTPVTVSFTCTDPTSSVPVCPDPVTLTNDELIYTIERSVTDVAGNSATVSVAVKLDSIPPELNLTQAPSPRTNSATARFAGTAGDAMELGAVTIGGAPVQLADGSFDAEFALEEGPNQVPVTAVDAAGNGATLTVAVERYTIPVVVITSPNDLDVVRSATVSVSGTVNQPSTTVVVNGVNASVSGNNFTASGVPLAQGRTVVTANVTNASGHSGTASILVYRDSIPPRVVVRSPANDSTVYSPAVNVAGMVDDIVVGTINSGQAGVTVNGVQAEVANRAFLARNVALTAGLNVLSITATDQGGNSVTSTTRVTYDASAQPRISVFSGNAQTAVIGTELPAPLVARVTNADGSPAVNRMVSFEIVENNGELRVGATTGRVVAALTDASGNASANWTLGTRAGAANNRVVATSAGFSGAVEFQAVARTGAPTLIVVDAGNQQFAAESSPLPRPLIAVAVDAGSNRVANVPVRFTVGEGGGSFDGANTITVNTDSDGRAIVTPMLGASRLNVYHANLPDIEAPATFSAYGKAAGPSEETSISGVILDNTDIPVEGVSVRVAGTNLVTQSNAQGQFALAGAPVGYVKLVVDGSTAQRPGTWPMLEYAMYTIPGANNTLETPIFMLPIDVTRGMFVDEVTGGTLTLPELPGFSLTVQPGSATFPGGSRTGTVSVTAVHADKMPMTPGFGQQPRFIVTIQPPGVHFDPPAAISFPNVDGLVPGEITEMYSFDHDIGQFVSIGTGSVTPDGTTLRSDAGVGIIKGGWHCNGNPPPGGTANCCPDCFKCENNTCVIDAAKTGTSCETGQTPNITQSFTHNSAATTVTVTVSDTCFKKCTGVQATPCDTISAGNPRWGYSNLSSAATTALSTLVGSCLGTQTKAAVWGGMAGKTFTITCVNSDASPNGTPACAYMGLNTTTLTITNRTSCGSLAKTIAHELLHGAGGINHVYTTPAPGTPAAPDCTLDNVYPCDQACFSQNNACPGITRACP